MSRNETATIELSGEFPNQVIRASAGTGKTFELSNRYLRLLASGVEASSILATTFTRKGAGEILDRIMERLSLAAMDETATMELSKQLQWQLTSKRAAAILHDLLQNLHRLEVGTLDSFFNRFAKAFSLELGLPPTWEIVEQQQIERLQDQAIQAILHSETAQSLMHLLSHGDAKRRIASEVRDTVRNLYEVFTDATSDAWEKIPKRAGMLDDAALTALIESMPGVELPELKSWRKAWDILSQRIVDGEWEKIVADGIVGKIAAGETKYQRREIPKNVRSVGETILKHCAAEITRKLNLRNVATRDLLQLFAGEFEPLKSSTGQLRFQDVTNRLAEFIESIDADGLTFRLDNQVRHLLLDEFQDTSPLQWNVMSPFARRVTQMDDGGTSFFCVGDVKQAIFGWRGGAAEIFDRVERELPNLADSAARTKSWRSSPQVIEFVNLVFQNLDRFQPDPKKYEPVAKSVHAWQDWFKEHETARADLDGCATVEFAQSVDGANGKPDAKESLFAATVSKVQQLNDNLPASKNIGVLVRTNPEIGEIIFRLRQLGIEASEEGGNPLTDAAAVEVVLSALKLADSPGDSLAGFHISHSPLGPHFGIAQQDDTNGARCRQQVVAAAKLIRRQLVELGYGAVVESMARVLAPDCTTRELNRLQQLVQVAYSNEVNRDAWQLRPSRFVNYIRDEYRAVAPSAARIRVMTVHRSKGLEFDAVVVPLRSGRGDQLVGLPPSVVTGRLSPTEPINAVTRYVSKETQALLPKPIQRLFLQHEALVIREAICLLYVAITRAVHATHVILSPEMKAKSATVASVVLSAVGDNSQRDEHDLLVHKSGNLDWHLAVETTENSAVCKEPSMDLAHFYLPHDAELVESMIASDVVSGRGTRDHTPTQPTQQAGTTFENHLHFDENQHARKLGSLVHSCFEQIEWLEETGLPSHEALTARLKLLEADPKVIQTAIDVFQEAIEQPNIRWLLTRSEQASRLVTTELVVLTEHRFAVLTETGLLTGSIDRLVLGYNSGKLVSAEIIDFKSDNVTASEAPARAKKYREQIAAYRQAVVLTFGMLAEQVQQSIVFTQIDQIETLEYDTMIGDDPSPPSSSHEDAPGERSQQTLW